MRRPDLILALVGTLGLWGCSSSKIDSFDRELQVTLRAGRGELSEDEKQFLLQENHPILAQVGDPNVSRVVEAFAQLPETARQQLLKESYLKWRLADLPQEMAVRYRESITYVVTQQMGAPPKNWTTEDFSNVFKDVEIGFAVVELAETKQKVVSWYAMGNAIPSPLWMTIVNAPASNGKDYVQSHLKRLPLLRSMRNSVYPERQLDHVTMLA